MLCDYQGNMPSMTSGDETWTYAYDQVAINKLREYRAKDEARAKRSRQNQDHVDSSFR